MQILPFKNLRKNEITSNHDLQTYFNMKLIPMLKKHNKRLMGWEEIMTKDMSKDALSMRGEEVMKGLPRWSALQPAKNGYNTVLSNGYYIDLMLSVDSHYLNDPLPKILFFLWKRGHTGREAAMWSELAAP
jgi:hexosaminidase